MKFIERTAFMRNVFDQPWAAPEQPTYVFSILNVDARRFDGLRIEERLVAGLVEHMKKATLSGAFTQLAWRHVLGWTASSQHELAHCLTIIRSAAGHNAGTQFWSAVVAQTPFAPAELAPKIKEFEWRANKIAQSVPPGVVQEIDLLSINA